MRSKFILAIIFILPILYIWSCNRNQHTVKTSDFRFPVSLASLGFFKDELSDLIPNEGVITYELSSTLFTDYAEKQRLIKLPKGKKMVLKGDGLPVFPEGTMIAKTFFYDGLPGEKTKQIIETRVLLLKKGKWFAGTYKWDKAQTRASYTDQSSTVPVEYRDNKGRYLHISYHIPSAEECQSCHRFADETIPIGPKAMNMNRLVMVKGKAVNQLEAFKTLNVLSVGKTDNISILPAYLDKNTSLEHRARAYLEINCAHCHNPAGMAYQQTIMLGYKVPLEQSGIRFKKDNIADRISAMGPFHMPKIGTTILDKEGVELIRSYLKSLPQ
jgi:uncharacterized repeat protein (TIGR03806 family)